MRKENLFSQSNIADLICPSHTFNLRSFRLQSIFTNNCPPKRKVNIPDDNVVSLFEPVLADDEALEEEVVSAWIQGGPWMTEPTGG